MCVCILFAVGEGGTVTLQSGCSPGAWETCLQCWCCSPRAGCCTSQSHVCYQQEDSTVFLSHGSAEGRDVLRILRPSDAALGQALQVFWEMGVNSCFWKREILFWKRMLIRMGTGARSWSLLSSSLALGFVLRFWREVWEVVLMSNATAIVGSTGLYCSEWFQSLNFSSQLFP